MESSWGVNLKKNRKIGIFDKNLSKPKLYNQIPLSHEFSQTFCKRGNVKNNTLQGRNRTRAITNDRLLRNLQKTPKRYRLAWVLVLANFTLLSYYFLLAQVNLLKPTQEVTSSCP